jgi:hypothetical protein
LQILSEQEHGAKGCLAHALSCFELSGSLVASDIFNS